MSAVESWFAAIAVAEPLPKQRARRAANAKQKPKARRRRGVRVRLPLVWMLLLALSLAGVVAVNVAVLRAHVSVNDLDTQIEQLQERNAQLTSRYSSKTAAPRVEKAAGQTGSILAPTADTKVLDMLGNK